MYWRETDATGRAAAPFRPDRAFMKRFSTA
jgi:hypothetical protein